LYTALLIALPSVVAKTRNPEPVPKFKLGLGASFDRLRTNGALPFVVSLSNHETLFCSIFGIASSNITLEK
jgi:hypothetical protein